MSVRCPPFCRRRTNPTAAHLKLPLFDWYALPTTNYDMILEDAFESGHASGQILRPLMENSDRMRLRRSGVVGSLKITLFQLPRRLRSFWKRRRCGSQMKNPRIPEVPMQDLERVLQIIKTCGRELALDRNRFPGSQARGSQPQLGALAKRLFNVPRGIPEDNAPNRDLSR
jgi:hypothetical protein